MNVTFLRERAVLGRRSSARPSARTCGAPWSAFPEREALVVRHQGYRATYRELWEQTTGVARGAPRPRGAEGRPGRHLVAEPVRVGACSSTPTARVGAILVNVNPAYRVARARVRAPPVGRLACWSSRRRSGRPTTSAMVARGAAPLPGAAPDASCIDDEWDDLLRRRARGVSEDELAAPRARAPVRRRRSTSSTPPARRASRRARRSPTTTSSTTATSSASACGYTEARPGLHPRAASTTASAW